MRHQSLDRFVWRDINLYFNNKKQTGYTVIKHPTYEKMYYCLTPKGQSLDFYNLSRAKDHTRKLAMRDAGYLDE
jgi:hypothetical protein